MRYWIAFKCFCRAIECIFMSWKAKWRAKYAYRWHRINRWLARKVINDEELFNNEKLHKQVIEILCLDREMRKRHFELLDTAYAFEETAIDFYVTMRRALGWH